MEAFVWARGVELMLGNDEFRFVGADVPWLLEAAAARDYAAVDHALDQAVEMGLRAVRTYAFSDGSGSTLRTPPLQYRASGFSEHVFKALDYIVWQAGRRSLKLVLPLVNYGSDGGGVAQYHRWAAAYDAYTDTESTSNISVAYATNWNAQSGSCPRFYTNAVTKDYYRFMLRRLLTRENTYNLMPYRQDPTIMMWELCNGCRCPGSAGDELFAWYEEMAAHVKLLAPSQLVATGGEGLFCRGAGGRCSTDSAVMPEAGATPADMLAAWADGQGTDFRRESLIANIDVAVFHDRPEAWVPALATHLQSRAAERNGVYGEWLTRHEEAIGAIGKPMVMDTFAIDAPNLWVSRTQLFRYLLNRMLGTGKTDGCFFSQLGRRTPDGLGPGAVDDDARQIATSPATPRHETSVLMRTIKSHADMLPGSPLIRSPPTSPPPPAPPVSPPPTPPVAPTPSYPPMPMWPPPLTPPPTPPAPPAGPWPMMPPLPPPSHPPPMLFEIVSGTCAEADMFPVDEGDCREHALHLAKPFSIVLEPEEHYGCNNWGRQVEYNSYSEAGRPNTCGNTPEQRCLCRSVFKLYPPPPPLPPKMPPPVPPTPPPPPWWSEVDLPSPPPPKSPAMSTLQTLPSPPEALPVHHSQSPTEVSRPPSPPDVSAQRLPSPSMRHLSPPPPAPVAVAPVTRSRQSPPPAPKIAPVVDTSYAYDPVPAVSTPPAHAISTAKITAVGKAVGTALVDRAATITGDSGHAAYFVAAAGVVAAMALLCCCWLASSRLCCAGGRGRPLRASRSQDDDVKRRLADDDDDDGADDEESDLRRGRAFLSSGGTFPQAGARAEDEVYLE